MFVTITLHTCTSLNHSLYPNALLRVSKTNSLRFKIVSMSRIRSSAHMGKSMYVQPELILPTFFVKLFGSFIKQPKIGRIESIIKAVPRGTHTQNYIRVFLIWYI